MKKIAFVPIRLNSKRVKGKNMKILGDRPLMRYVLETLIKIKNIDEIYVYCSSREILPFIPDGVKFLQRDERLDSDETLGCDIYESFVNEINADMYILVHTTSPFIKDTTIAHAVDLVEKGYYDSAFSAEKIQTFTWFNGKPLNYILDFVPRTQDIEPIYVETSAFYIFTKELWKTQKRRIGDHPYMAEVDRIEGMDIDNNDDFELASYIAKSL